jgi:hypothetical protein
MGQNPASCEEFNFIGEITILNHCLPIIGNIEASKQGINEFDD